jgi:hypothetical protein
MDENNKSDQFMEDQKPLDDEPVLDLTQEIPGNALDDDSGYHSEEGYDEFGGGHDDDDDFVTSLGMEIDSHDEDDEAPEAEDISSPPDTAFDGALEISPEQLDAALERVIQQMFYDRIDRILVDVIERRVKREIDRIKGILLGDTSDESR